MRITRNYGQHWIVHGFRPFHQGKTAASRRSGRASFHRQLLLVLTAIAFVAQGFIAQTHIHGITQTALTVLSAGKALPEPSKEQVPSAPDEKNCPLCRLSAFVGSCVVPLAAIILLPSALAPLPLAEPAQFSFIEAASFHWQTRAPPR